MLGGRDRALFEQAPLGIVVLDMQLRVRDANAKLAELLGVAIEETTGMDLGAAIDDPGFAEALRNARAGVPGTFEGHLALRASREGRRPWVTVRTSALRDATGAIEGVTAFVEDGASEHVSERALAAARAEAQDASGLFKLVADTASVAVHVFLANRSLYVNPRFTELWGYTLDEVRALSSPLMLVAPEERDRVKATIEARERGTGSVRYMTRCLRKDGTTFEAEVFGSAMDLQGGRAVVGTVIDISDRIKLERELREAQKLEAVGRFAGSIAHDFNNLLSVTLSYASILLDELAADDPLRRDVDEIRLASERAAALTSQLLTFSRRQVTSPRVVDLEAKVEELRSLLERLVGEDVRVEVTRRASNARVYADPTQLDQIVMNLAVNARDAMPEGGSLVIETSDGTLPAGEPCVVMAVTDSGVGIEPSVQSRIFEPFFTTKPRGKGTGLGLATVFGIVESCGGRVTVDSKVGRGSTFEVRIPTTVRPVDRTRRVSRVVSTTLKGRERVLLVEDQDIVRRTMATVLKRQGYQVVDACDGDEALRIHESRRDAIDLLVTDLVMPGLTGRQLCDRLRAISPRLKVLYVSGYAEDVAVARGILEPGVAFLPKPIVPDVLLLKVRDVLAAS